MGESEDEEVTEVFNEKIRQVFICPVCRGVLFSMQSYQKHYSESHSSSKGSSIASMSSSSEGQTVTGSQLNRRKNLARRTGTSVLPTSQEIAKIKAANAAKTSVTKKSSSAASKNSNANNPHLDQEANVKDTKIEENDNKRSSDNEVSAMKAEATTISGLFEDEGNKSSEEVVSVSRTEISSNENVSESTSESTPITDSGTSVPSSGHEYLNGVSVDALSTENTIRIEGSESQQDERSGQKKDLSITRAPNDSLHFDFQELLPVIVNGNNSFEMLTPPVTPDEDVDEPANSTKGSENQRSVSKTFPCHFCKLLFVRERTLIFHIKANHKDELQREMEVLANETTKCEGENNSGIGSKRKYVEILKTFLSKKAKT